MTSGEITFAFGQILEDFRVFEISFFCCWGGGFRICGSGGPVGVFENMIYISNKNHGVRNVYLIIIHRRHYKSVSVSVSFP